MFSWFSMSRPRLTQKDVSAPGTRQIEPKTVIDTMEALGILIADPALNRKREKLKDAYEAIQKEAATPQTIRNYLQEITKKLDKAKN